VEKSVVCKVPSVRHTPSEETWDALRNEDPSYASLAIHWRREAEKERSVYVLGGVVPEGRTLCTNAADVMTTCAAIAERMIYAKVGGKLLRRAGRDKEYYDQYLDVFKYKVVKAVGRTLHPETPQEFVESYKGRKRTIYESYLDEYLHTGAKRIHAVFNTFMKVEKVPINKTPRTIQPRSPIYNIGLGRYLKRAEKRIFRAMAKVWKQRHVVFKGLNAVDMAKEMKAMWDKYSRPVAVGLDASRFDASVDAGLLEHEHSLYNMLFRDRELRRLLSYQLNNVGRARCFDGTIRYKVRGGRGSGDMNTSLGNSYIMCAIIWVWLWRQGVKASLANNGDDCVVILEDSDLDKFRDGFDSYASELGFTMVVEAPVYDFELIEFCQTQPVWDGADWRMVRNLHKSREKDSMCLFPIDSPGARQSWLHAVGECGMALTAGLPVLQEMYTAFKRNGRPSKMADAPYMMSRGRMALALGMSGDWREVTDDARYSFYVAFGVTPDEQVALEDYYRGWEITDGVVSVDDIGGIGCAPL